MDVFKYRKIILHGGDTVRLNKTGPGGGWYLEGWTQITIKVSPGLKYYKRKGELSALCYYNNNHPLVHTHHAYWTNDNTLVTGYILQNNKNIFHPIFQHKRERLFKNVKEWINHDAKFQVAHRRNYLYKKILMDTKKNFPEDMINEILSWTYDPDLLM